MIRELLAVAAVVLLSEPATARVIDFEQYQIGDRPSVFTVDYEGHNVFIFKASGIIVDLNGSNALKLDYESIYKESGLFFGPTVIGMGPGRELTLYGPDIVSGDFYFPNGGTVGIQQVAPAVLTTVAFGRNRSLAYGTYGVTIHGDVYLDNLQFEDRVVQTPEPATWAMMLLGFGAIGLGARTRSNRAGGQHA